VQANSEVTLVAKLAQGNMGEYAVEQERICLLNARAVEAAYDQILELAINKELLDLRGMSRLRIGAALWHGGLPVDVLPAEGVLDVQLGEENFAWPIVPLTL
jgi:hypothetical protein